LTSSGACVVGGSRKVQLPAAIRAPGLWPGSVFSQEQKKCGDHKFQVPARAGKLFYPERSRALPGVMSKGILNALRHLSHATRGCAIFADLHEHVGETPFSQQPAEVLSNRSRDPLSQIRFGRIHDAQPYRVVWHESIASRR
jgi:hypothetical protein